MIVETFTNNQFNRLPKLQLPSGVTTLECDLYVINKKINHQKLILKKYKKTKGEYFGNKLLTINTLINNRNKINIEELIYPEKIAIVGKEIIGFTMNFIERSTNLSILLNNGDISLHDKIEWLKQVSCILSKVQYVDSMDYPFLLGDIHEDNFILNHDTGKIVCVDLDGCKISNNKIYSMKYGSFNPNFYDLPNKYPLDDEEEPIPNHNTEWYCYIVMILNMIAKGPVHKLMIQDFYDYIQYLRDAGFPNELLKCFSNVYTNHDNYSPRDLLEQIPNNLDEVKYNDFVQKTNTKHIYL